MGSWGSCRVGGFSSRKRRSEVTTCSHIRAVSLLAAQERPCGGCWGDSCGQWWPPVPAGSTPFTEGLFLCSTSHPPEMTRNSSNTLGGRVSQCPGLNATLSFRQRNSLFTGPSRSWESNLSERYLIDFCILGP